MRSSLFLLLVFILLSAPGVASATTISYVATDLADTTPGEDLWEYEYSVSGPAFPAGHGFSVFFDYTKYTKLEDPPPAVGADWDIISLQPDLVLPDDGIYDALAVIGSPSISQLFTVTFVWLGANLPSAQPFTVYDSGFTPIEVGMTVPEVKTSGLLVLAALWINRLRRPRRS